MCFRSDQQTQAAGRDAGGCHHHAGSEASGPSGKEEVKGATGITEADEIPEQQANDCPEWILTKGGLSCEHGTWLVCASWKRLVRSSPFRISWYGIRDSPMNLLTNGFVNNCGQLFGPSEQFEADIVEFGRKGFSVNGCESRPAAADSGRVTDKPEAIHLAA
jgi:hypothetical protein